MQTLINAELYDALIAANVPEEKAKAAAQSVVYEQRLGKIEMLLKVHSVMLAYLVGVTSITLWKVFELTTQVAKLTP